VASVSGCPSSAPPGPAAGPTAGAKQAAGGYGAQAAFDPVKENGPIFEGWPKPDYSLVLTGGQFGYLEPCGCAGIENQKGGLSRRHSLIKQLASQGWNPIPLDLGDQIRRSGPQSEIKFDKTLSGLATMGYQAVGLGVEDLRLLTGAALFSQFSGAERPPLFVSANVSMPGVELPRFKIIDTAGRKIGVTSVLGQEYQSRIPLDDEKDLVFAAPAQALAQIVPQLEAAKCDHLVLLSNAPPSESKALAAQFPQFDIVVTAEGADEPRREPELLDGKRMFVELGHKGMFAVVLGFYGDPASPVRYQRVPLDARFPASAEMAALLRDYQKQLEAVGLAGLGVTASVHPAAASADDLAGQFVGSKVCGECHTKAYRIWSTRPSLSEHGHGHAAATATLTKLDPPRQFDPECLSCHATGWNPKEYYPYATGFASLQETPLLAGNGCENCHGPGAAHVAAERGQDRALQDKLRQSVRRTKGEAEQQLCAKCHDHDNSPDFNFETYWPKIEHVGKD
jgi:hypothetical protein